MRNKRWMKNIAFTTIILNLIGGFTTVQASDLEAFLERVDIVDKADVIANFKMEKLSIDEDFKLDMPDFAGLKKLSDIDAENEKNETTETITASSSSPTSRIEEITIEGIWCKEKGALYVPASELAKAIGCKLEWNQVTQTIKIYSDTDDKEEVEWYMGHNIYSVNIGGTYSMELDLPCKIIEGRFSIPVSMLGEIIRHCYADKQLIWEKDYNRAKLIVSNKHITINSPKNIIQNISQDTVKKKIAELKNRFPNGRYWGHSEDLEQEVIKVEEVILAKYGRGYYAGLTINQAPLVYSKVFECYGPKEGVSINAYRNGSECAGFASYCSDYIFGYDVPKRGTKNDYSKIKIGDVVRINNTHSVIVIDKSNNGIKVAEANSGGYNEIRWGRTISKSTLMNSTFLIESRY